MYNPELPTIAGSLCNGPDYKGDNLSLVLEAMKSNAEQGIVDFIEQRLDIERLFIHRHGYHPEEFMLLNDIPTGYGFTKKNSVAAIVQVRDYYPAAYATVQPNCTIGPFVVYECGKKPKPWKGDVYQSVDEALEALHQGLGSQSLYLL